MLHRMKFIPISFQSQTTFLGLVLFSYENTLTVSILSQESLSSDNALPPSKSHGILLHFIT